MKSHEYKEVMKKKEALEWYVDFVNMDLETIKPGDKAKLLIESYGPLYPDTGLNFRELSKMPMSQEEAEIMSRIIKALPDRESKEYWEMILNLQEVVKELFYDFQKSDEPVSFRRIEDVILTIYWGENTPFDIHLFPSTESNEKYVCFRIFLLLNGFPGHAINVCPVCEKFFLNTSFRKKTFCSPNCMWKSNSAKQRKKDPEKYRKYQRELMRKKSIKAKGLDNQKLKEPKRKSKEKGGK